jgi:hypothetical protein
VGAQAWQLRAQNAALSRESQRVLFAYTDAL